MLLRLVDQDRELLGTDLGGTVAEDKEHGVDNVGLAAAVGPNDAGETLDGKSGEDVC